MQPLRVLFILLLLFARLSDAAEQPLTEILSLIHI